MGAVSGIAPSAVEADALVFRLADAEHDHEDVKVWFDVELGVELGMAKVEGGWELRLEMPDLDCLEYLFDIDGTLVPDPTNRDVVDGAFGPHSWLAMPGYAPPGWVDLDPVEGLRLEAGPDLEGVAEVWQPAALDADAELPLLLVHDGPEMDEYGGVTRYAGALIGAGTLPPFRVALLRPGARDDRYSANPAYGAELADELVPALTDRLPTRRRPVLLGQSLGALAALHAAWTAPGLFAGLMLQSGSFFTPLLDPQESEFGHFDRVTGFVASVLAATAAAPAPPFVAMTCGTAEENYANNLQMRDHLREVGMNVSWGEVRQGHTWMCWRDTLDPHLTELLRSVWD